MNFGTVLGVVSKFLEDHGYRHAVIGGVALVAYGLPRTTLDLDFITEAAAQDELVAFLEARGYQTLNRSTGYSNHRHSDPEWGQLDFVYVRGETSERLFLECRHLQGPGGREIFVPRPEYLAALKVLAMKNDSARLFQDMADVRFLLAMPGVDRREVRDYFERHGLEERFNELEKTL